MLTNLSVISRHWAWISKDLYSSPESLPIMKLINFKEKINVFLKANPELDMDDIGVLLFIDSLYKSVPKDIEKFRNIYAHFDPRVIDSHPDGMTFLDLAKSKDPTSVLKHRLNTYVNGKFNAIGKLKSYRQNMETFKRYSGIASDLLADVLSTSEFPKEVTTVLTETDEIRQCDDFYDMLLLFRTKRNKRIRFEILRKLGLIVLISRISRTFLIRDIDFALEEVKKVFFSGLGLKRKKKRYKYLWIDSRNNVAFTDSKKAAKESYEQAVKKRNDLALKMHLMQVFVHTPFKSKFGSEVLHFEMRNKLKKIDKVSYTSFVEKMFRKDLEFPNQVHDVIGIKIIVGNEEEIPQMIKDLEIFLGGSSMRKKEKNALNKFGKKRLGKYSSKDYSVWKAVYDIPLPHPSLQKFKRLLTLTKGNAEAQKEIRNRIAYFRERPIDFVVEVQIQQLSSYLLSIAKGSVTDHSYLKMNQIRSNSFYKFFPKEIYRQELFEMRKKLLGL